jgi:hypothetical protein
MKLAKKITNGMIIIFIGLLHTQCAVTSSGFGKQFLEFSKSYFFMISPGASEFPAEANKTDFETHAAFWFFYFGLLLIPLGILAHSIEKGGKTLPHAFTISYLILVMIGCYMVPNSGMSFFMLPHAIYMLLRNNLKAKRA